MPRSRATAVAVAVVIAVAIGLVATVFVVSVGASRHASHGPSSRAVVGVGASRHSSHGPSSGAFSWLRPAPPPPGWNVARSTAGALAHPARWTPIKTDPGTASVALLGRDGLIDAYLNATPHQGTETLANWSHFRPAHNTNEGNRNLRVVASSTNLTFRSGRGSCVIDDYTTSRARYREIACLVAGPTSSAVIVAAARTALWNRHAATLERAVSSFVP
jgi:hypothetical protein